MPLDRQIVEIPLGHGLAEKTGVHQLSAGQATTIKNLVFRKSGELQRRDGYQGMPLTHIDPSGNTVGNVSLSALATTAQSLFGIGAVANPTSDGSKNLFEYFAIGPTAGLPVWRNRGDRLPRYYTRKLSLCSGIVNPTSNPISCALNGMILTGWCQAGFWWLVVTSEASGDVIWGPYQCNVNGGPSVAAVLPIQGFILVQNNQWAVALAYPNATDGVEDGSVDFYFTVLDPTTLTFVTSWQWFPANSYFGGVTVASSVFGVAITTWLATDTGAPGFMVAMIYPDQTGIAIWTVTGPIGGEWSLGYYAKWTNPGRSFPSEQNIDFVKLSPVQPYPQTLDPCLLFLGNTGTSDEDDICYAALFPKIVTGDGGTHLIGFHYVTTPSALYHSTAIWAIMRGACYLGSGDATAIVLANIATQSGGAFGAMGWGLTILQIDMTTRTFAAMTGQPPPVSRGLTLASDAVADSAGTVKILIRQNSQVVGNGSVSVGEILQGSYYLTDIQWSGTTVLAAQSEAAAFLRQVGALQVFYYRLPSLLASNGTFICPVAYGQGTSKDVSFSSGALFFGPISAQGIDRVEFRPMAIIAPPVRIGDGMLIPGGLPTYFDGDTLTDVGMTWPEIINAEVGTTTAIALGKGTYYYRCIFETAHSNGDIEISGPSEMQTAIIPNESDGHGTVTLYVEPPFLSRNWFSANKIPNITLNVYRTTQADQINFRLYQRVPLTDFNQQVVVDAMSDLALMETSPPFIPTTGGSGEPLEAVTPPSCTCGCVYANRLWLGGTDDPTTIWYSTQEVAGTTPSWNEGFTLTIPDGGDVIALAPLGNKLVILKDSSVWVIYGDGPAPNGTSDDFSAPQCISWNIGCLGPQTVCLADDGVYWQSTRGIYKLDQNLGLSFVGAAVENEFSGHVATCSFNQDSAQVLCWIVNGNIVCYDYVFNQWSTEDCYSLPSQSGAVLAGVRGILNQDGRVFHQVAGAMTDIASPSGEYQIASAYETGDLKLGSIVGYQRAFSISAILQHGETRNGSTNLVSTVTLGVRDSWNNEIIACSYTSATAGNERRVKSLLPGYRFANIRVSVFENGNSSTEEAPNNAPFILRGLVLELGVFPGVDRRPITERTT